MARSTTGVHQGHQARKRFGQNFLVDDGVIHAIVAAIDPQPDDVLVEIGPGLGALTIPLMDRVRTLQVVELDRDLVARLQKRFGDRLIVHAGDALAFDFGALHEAGRPLRIVGNLPYNISSPLLFHLAAFADRVRDQHFMLQKEVVDRMAAGPGSKVYGRLSVMLQAYCQVTSLFVVPPGAFRPPPKVDSAVVRLVPRDPASININDHKRFAEVVKAAFGQRRKTLRNALNNVVSAEQFVAAGVRPDARAEQLDVAEFIALANAS